VVIFVPDRSIYRRIRVLVLGKTGVGKTSLIKRAFDLPHLQPSHYEPGKCDINQEIQLPDDIHFIIHDSRGFEPGEWKYVDIVEKFIQDRRQQPNLKDKLHAIWYCIQIPHAGGRVFEKGDERLMQCGFGDIPIIVVFTQYDRLYDQTEYVMDERHLDGKDDATVEVIVESGAKVGFQELCLDPFNRVAAEMNPNATHDLRWAKVSHLERYLPECQDLIKQTDEVVRNFAAKHGAERQTRARHS